MAQWNIAYALEILITLYMRTYCTCKTQAALLMVGIIQRRKKQRRKQIEEKKSHHGGLSTPQTPDPAFCWCWFVGIVVVLQLPCTDAAAIKAIRAEL